MGDKPHIWRTIHLSPHNSQQHITQTTQPHNYALKTAWDTNLRHECERQGIVKSQDEENASENDKSTLLCDLFICLVL